MAFQPSRRDVLVAGLGVAGLLTRGPLPLAWAAPVDETRMGQSDRSSSAPTSPVAIERCSSYEPQVLRTALDQAFDHMGGLKKLVENKTVTIKLNLTGGQAGKIGGLEPFETYHTHPKFVAAVCAALHGAGAKRIVLVESHYSLKPPEETLIGLGWDVRAIQSAGGNTVEFVNTRNLGTAKKYTRMKVNGGGFMYPAYDLHPAYEQTDVFVSLAKMKEHAVAGVTLTAKNLFGITPQSLYGDGSPNENNVNARLAILHEGTQKVPAGLPTELKHGLATGDVKHRVPRVTADLFIARPLDLAIIDGIQTNRGGEGPWIDGVTPVQPKLIFVGRNGVCTDSICAATMGYNPQGRHDQAPYQGDNHLRLLAAAGMGSNDPNRIEVRGLKLGEASFPFKAAAKS